MNWQSFVRVRLRDRSPVTLSVISRLFFVVAAVIVTHQLEWAWLRTLTSEAVLRLSIPLGTMMTRVSADTISLGCERFRIVTSCTFVDVIAGAIPLVWNLKRSIVHNVLTLLPLVASCIAFNILRLEITQLLHIFGVPWAIAHGVLGGVAYFVVWVFLVRRFSRNWFGGPITFSHSVAESVS